MYIERYGEREIPDNDQPTTNNYNSITPILVNETSPTLGLKAGDSSAY